MGIRADQGRECGKVQQVLEEQLQVQARRVLREVRQPRRDRRRRAGAAGGCDQVSKVQQTKVPIEERLALLRHLPGRHRATRPHCYQGHSNQVSGEGEGGDEHCQERYCEEGHPDGEEEEEAGEREEEEREAGEEAGEEEQEVWLSTKLAG